MTERFFDNDAPPAVVLLMRKTDTTEVLNDG